MALQNSRNSIRCDSNLLLAVISVALKFNSTNYSRTIHWVQEESQSYFRDGMEVLHQFNSRGPERVGEYKIDINRSSQ